MTSFAAMVTSRKVVETLIQMISVQQLVLAQLTMNNATLTAQYHDEPISTTATWLNVTSSYNVTSTAATEVCTSPGKIYITLNFLFFTLLSVPEGSVLYQYIDE